MIKEFLNKVEGFIKNDKDAELFEHITNNKDVLIKLDDLQIFDILKMIIKYDAENCLDIVVSNKILNTNDVNRNILDIKGLSKYNRQECVPKYEQNILTFALDEENFYMISQIFKLVGYSDEFIRFGIIDHEDKGYTNCQLHYNFIGFCLHKLKLNWYKKDLNYLRGIKYIFKSLCEELKSTYVVEKHLHHDKHRKLDFNLPITLNEKKEELKDIENTLRENLFADNKPLNDNFARSNVIKSIIDMID
ncbi:hypothetical protein [Clostridium frigidicarnis]|uniref:Uncharacterized protein n=1 Tax=Clostridium frigidicarnis TaxID=84698 RepID=A0A1I1AKG5_9CLOT|nr:hypothetical protein [Clostridium frigidicarnis]SFB38515.1 hypothetical protein SAMN04488528_103914 [Clostridium frigidicarnis]